MLGGLARRLRILGLDTLHDPALDDDELVARAFAEDRVMLTRDRRIARDWNVDGIVCLTGDTTDEQLVELAMIVPFGEQLRLFSRCSICNTELAAASRDEVEMSVPAAVLAMNSAFVRCPSCRRIYWGDRTPHACGARSRGCWRNAPTSSRTRKQRLPADSHRLARAQEAWRTEIAVADK